ncbi:Exocyst complex component EXO70H1 [Linum perenne]
MRSHFFKSPIHSPAASPPRRHTFSETLMEENIDNAYSLISKWEELSSSSSTAVSLFSDDRGEAKRYISAVKELQAAMKYYVSWNPASENLGRAQSLMQKAMRRLEKEFYLILRSNREQLDAELVSRSYNRTLTLADLEDGEVTDGDDTPRETEISEVEGDSIVAISDLKSIADCMIGAGYTKECVKIYQIIRKSIVDEGLYRLGVDRFSLLQIHKLDSEVLESKIKTWLYAVKVAVKTLFNGERLLCDHVFSSSLPIRESCFVEIVREGALDLFGFAENFTKGKKSLEQMFRTLDIYEAISDLWPEIESIFEFESTAPIRNRAVNSLIKLGEAVRTTLSDLEMSITKDNSKMSVPGGGVHPLTRYVMNYISLLSDYSGVLSDIVADWPLEFSSPLPETYFHSPTADDDGGTSPISVRLAWLILVLLCKLDGKAQSYKDVALCYLFLANNLNYVVNKVRSSNLKFHLGDEWIEKHSKKVRQYAANYERVGWDKVISSLNSSPATVHQAAECFRKFNSAFEEAYRKQSSWVVPHSRLRDEIKISVARKIGPAYRSLYERYRTAVVREFGRENGSVRYAPDDLENYWSDLFYGVSSGSDAGSSVSSCSSSRSSVSSAGRGGSSH